jgi:hypothetical protein
VDRSTAVVCAYARAPSVIAVNTLKPSEVNPWSETRSQGGYRNIALQEYGGLVCLLFHLFILTYEEPTLRANFGSEYEAFACRSTEMASTPHSVERPT